MTTRLFSALLVGTLLLGGCHHYHGVFAKRESEKNCPTDIRKTVPWCVGEDAIFHCPCGPDPEFYGHKPTCWGIWPAPAAQWRQTYCGPLPEEDIYPYHAHDACLPLPPLPAELEREIQMDRPATGESEALPKPSAPTPADEGTSQLRSHRDRARAATTQTTRPRDERKQQPTPAQKYISESTALFQRTSP